MTTSVIVAGARTPIGKLMGSLKDFSASDLGAIAIAGALEKANVPADLVEYVIMGQVLTAGAGQMPARQAAVAAGIGWDVPALSINKMCLSGIDAIALADQLIRAGEFDVVVAGGQESMTKAPHLLMDSRAGYKYGDVTVLDHMAYDGLHDVFTDQPMGALTEQRNDVDKFTREEQDQYAARSHQRAAAAWKDGVFTDEVVPVNIPQRKGDPLQFTEDEGIRANTTAESLAGLKPAFRKDGTITAGSASQISDGAAAVVVMSKAKAQQLGLSWLAEIGAHGVVAGPDSTLAVAAGQRHQEGARSRGHLGRPARRGGDQRGVCGRGAGLDPRTRRESRHRQRQRRCDRGRAPDRDVGGADHPACRAGIVAARLGLRGRGPVRGRRAGRRPDSAGGLASGRGVRRGCWRWPAVTKCDLRHIGRSHRFFGAFSGAFAAAGPVPERRRHRVERLPMRMPNLTT